MDVKDIHELVLKRVNGNKNYNLMIFSKFTDNVLSYLKTTPLLVNLPYTKFIFYYNDTTYDKNIILGRTNSVGVIYIYIDNIMYTSCIEAIKAIISLNESDDEYILNLSKKYTPIFALYKLLCTIVHECFHMHSADNYDKYMEDEKYNAQVELNVEYSSHKFIESHIEDFKYIISKYSSDCELIPYLIKDDLKADLDDCEFVKEIKLNDPIAITCNLLDSIVIEGSWYIIDSIRELLYYGYSLNIIIEYENDKENEKYIIYEDGLVNYIAIKYITNVVAGARLKASIDVYEHKCINLTLTVKDTKIFTPALIPIMRKVDDNEFKSNK